MRPWRAHRLVAEAVKDGHLPRLDGGIPCKDCGRPAAAYDHRDYDKPLDVEPVCNPCNLRRGAGANRTPPRGARH